MASSVGQENKDEKCSTAFSTASAENCFKLTTTLDASVLYVPPVQLAALSHYFAVLCQSADFSEGRRMEALIKDETEGDLRDYLLCTLSGRPITDSNFHLLARLADKFATPTLQTALIDFGKRSVDGGGCSLKKALSMFASAVKYNLPESAVDKLVAHVVTFPVASYDVAVGQLMIDCPEAVVLLVKKIVEHHQEMRRRAVEGVEGVEGLAERIRVTLLEAKAEINKRGV